MAREPENGKQPANGSDEDLIRRFTREGDESAFRELALNHLTSIRRIVYGVLNGSREDREDAEQEILAGLFLDLAKFRFRSSFGTFLFRYARNKAIDILRKKAREKRALLSVIQNGTTYGIKGPEASYLEKEGRQDLQTALDGLTGEERSLIVMKDVERLSIEKIAAILRRPAGTVKSRLHRTRARLLRIMKEGNG
jgi:RNA polymerase sigma-70 factor, ECF subfamily